MCHYFLVGLCVVCTLTESAVSILMLIVVPLMACDLKYSKADVTVLNSCYSLGILYYCSCKFSVVQYCCNNASGEMSVFSFTLNPSLLIINHICCYIIYASGCACGSIIFGPMCDLRGRKNTISVTLVVIFASALVLAFSQIHALSLFSMFALGAGFARFFISITFQSCKKKRKKKLINLSHSPHRLTGNNLSLRVYMLEFLPPKKRGACLAILDFFWIIGHIFALGKTLQIALK